MAFILLRLSCYHLVILLKTEIKWNPYNDRTSDNTKITINVLICIVEVILKLLSFSFICSVFRFIAL